MRLDIGSNFLTPVGLPALSRTADTYYTASVNHGLAAAVAYIITCGTWATSFVATLQHSPDNSVWTDEADTSAGNEVSETLTEAGEATLNCPNPRAQYTRLKIVIGGTCVFSVSPVAGPRRSF